MRPFHLAFPVNDLAETRVFFTRLFDCTVGRESDHSIVFDFFGHQLVAHLSPEETRPVPRNAVDRKNVPVRHFGVVLEWEQWQALADRLQKEKVEFIIAPYIRYAGTSGEQATMFFCDPSGNALEFKAFRDDAHIFSGWREGERE